jgi:hypothetical protein
LPTLIVNGGNFFPFVNSLLLKAPFPAIFSDGISVAQHLGTFCMIEALFSQPNYLAAKKMLDAVALCHEAIARNLANLTAIANSRDGRMYPRDLPQTKAGRYCQRLFPAWQRHLQRLQEPINKLTL